MQEMRGFETCGAPRHNGLRGKMAGFLAELGETFAVVTLVGHLMVRRDRMRVVRSNYCVW